MPGPNSEPVAAAKSWLQSANLMVTLQTEFDKLFHTVIFVKHMKPHIAEQLEHPTSRQVMFALIGNQMVREHYSEWPNTPQILYPPYLSDDMRKELLQEARYNLANHIVKSAEEGDFHSEAALGAFKEAIAHTYKLELLGFKKVKRAKQKQRGRVGSMEAGEGEDGGGEDGVMRRLRANKKVSTYDEVGSALESILDHSAFAIQPHNIPENIRHFFGPNMGGNSWSLPKKIFSKVVGRIFPKPLRAYLYKAHLMSDAKKDYKVMVNNAAAEKGLMEPWRTSIDVGDSSYLSISLRTAFTESLAAFDQGMFEKGRRVLNMLHTLTGKERSELKYVLLPILWNFDHFNEYEIVGLLER